MSAPKPERKPINDPAGEPPHAPTEGVERPRPRPSSDPDGLGTSESGDERRPRPDPVI